MVRVIFFTCLAATICFVRAQAVPLKRVDLGYASYQTDISLANGVTSFLGIRFAAPPTGRWDLTISNPANSGLAQASCASVLLWHQQ